MRFTKMDDPIKGIGFVAIYFANLEDELDELVKLSSYLFKLPANINRWTFRNKAKWLQKQLRTAFAAHPYPRGNEESVRVDQILAACRATALQRNEILHQPIFGNTRGGALQKSTSGKMRPLDCHYVYRFAEHVYNLGGGVYAMRFSLGRLLTATQGHP